MLVVDEGGGASTFVSACRMHSDPLLSRLAQCPSVYVRCRGVLRLFAHADRMWSMVNLKHQLMLRDSENDLNIAKATWEDAAQHPTSAALAALETAAPWAVKPPQLMDPSAVLPERFRPLPPAAIKVEDDAESSSSDSGSSSSSSSGESEAEAEPDDDVPIKRLKQEAKSKTKTSSPARSPPPKSSASKAQSPASVSSSSRVTSPAKSESRRRSTRRTPKD